MSCPVTPILPVRKIRHRKVKFLLKVTQLVSDGWNLNPVLSNSRICPLSLTQEVKVGSR